MVILMKTKELYINLLRDNHIMNESSYQYFELYQFHKGEYLLMQGQRLDYLYILVEGKLKISHTTANGLTILNCFAYPIYILGEVEFLNHKDVINNIYALEDTYCLRLSIELYQEILFHDSIFMCYLAKSIAYKLYNTNHNSSISLNYPVENRLASYLVACEKEGVIEDNFVLVAEMIGCSYRQLQRVLNSFCQKKYVKKIKRSCYEILDESILKQLSKDLYLLQNKWE